MTARLTVLYGRDADAYLVARDADRALEGHHVRAMVDPGGTEAVWLVERDDPIALGRWFQPGQLLVVTHDDGWRIEDAAPERAA